MSVFGILSGLSVATGTAESEDYRAEEEDNETDEKMFAAQQQQQSVVSFHQHHPHPHQYSLPPQAYGGMSIMYDNNAHPMTADFGGSYLHETASTAALNLEQQQQQQAAAMFNYSMPNVSSSTPSTPGLYHVHHYHPTESMTQQQPHYRQHHNHLLPANIEDVNNANSIQQQPKVKKSSLKKKSKFDGPEYSTQDKAGKYSVVSLQQNTSTNEKPTMSNLLGTSLTSLLGVGRGKKRSKRAEVIEFVLKGGPPWGFRIKQRNGNVFISKVSAYSLFLKLARWVEIGKEYLCIVVVIRIECDWLLFAFNDSIVVEQDQSLGAFCLSSLESMNLNKHT